MTRRLARLSLPAACCLLLAGCSMPSITFVTVVLPGGRNVVQYGMHNRADETESTAGAVPTTQNDKPGSWTPLGE